MTLWMLYAILFATLAAGAGFALERGARVLAVPTRFVWLALLAAAIVGPVAMPTSTTHVAASERVELVAGPAAGAGPVTPVAGDVSWFEVIVDRAGAFDRPVLLLWVALSAFCLARFAMGIVTLRRQRAQWVAREIEGTECFVTTDIGPAVVAMPDARIIVPEWVLSLDADSLATVIRHERQHKVARDGWLIVTGSIATALFPWNPAVWLIQRRLRLAVEMDCDARVLAEEPRVNRYGSLLLAIAQRPRLMAGLGATLTESTSDLERRIDAMTIRPPKHPRLRALLFAALGTAAIAIACSMPAPDMVAPQALANPAASTETFFDFQVEKPASADPSNMPPRYPDVLRAARIQGSVIGKFVVDTLGHVDMRSFAVISADHEDFVTAVREALPNMRFYPARVGGRPVKQLIQMPFTFSLVGGRSSPQPRAPRTPNVLYESPAADSMPLLLGSNSPPVYPNQLRAANIEGMVQAKFVVRADGKVDLSSFIATRSDHELFTVAVRAAAEHWRFRPAMRDGKAVSKLVSMPFMFTLTR